MISKEIERTDAPFTKEQLERIKSCLAELTILVSFSQNMRKEEQSALSGADNYNRTFTEDAVRILSTAGMYPSIDTAQLQQDLSFFWQLQELTVSSRQLAQKLEDSLAKAGSQAYSSAHAIYKLMDPDSSTEFPDTKILYEKLKSRFADNDDIVSGK